MYKVPDEEEDEGMGPLHLDLRTDDWEEAQIPEEVLGGADFVEDDEAVCLNEEGEWQVSLGWKEDSAHSQEEELWKERRHFEKESFIC